MSEIEHDVADLGLVQEGRRRIAWADAHMPVVAQIRERFAAEKPLEGIGIAACLHVTTETANLVSTLVAGGGEVRLCASNPLSTQDDVAAAMVADHGVPVFAIRGEDRETYYRHLNAALDHGPQITMDDGADLVATLHSQRQDLARALIGGTEETTTGVIRLRSLAAEGRLLYPIIAVNDAQTKHLFDNRYGTGQSTIDGILRATNILLAGQRFVICGYGWCGRGLAARARGMGAKVYVVEVDPLRALEATMDGFEVVPMSEAAPIGDIFVTVAGNTSVIRMEHLRKMKDGAIVANAGHFDVEVDILALEREAEDISHPREHVTRYQLPGGPAVNVLAEGRLVNLAAAEGHPAAVMDMSFANQALCVEYLVKNGRDLGPQVYPVPAEIDATVARLKLASLGIRLEELTEEQREYLASWEMGT